ncbi:MAG: DinB family protein, partial [Pyrinomonadaceae bacterium]
FLESKELLQTITAETEKINEDARQLIAGLSEEQLNWKPAADRWSIAQCFDHLAVTSQEFDPFFTDAIERGRQKWPVSGAVRYRPTWLGGWLINQLLPEATRKVRTPKVFRPSDASAIHGAFEKFLRQQEVFLRFVGEAAGLDYNKTRLRSPASPLLRYSLADAFVMTVVHGRRHLSQAGRVRKEPGFPAV